MCGRYVSATPVEELADYFAARPDVDLGDLTRPRYNIPPTETVLGVVEDRPRPEGRERPGRPGSVADADADAGHGEGAGGEGAGGAGAGGAGAASRRRIRAYRWGLVPPWAKDPSVGNRAFNARAESVATKPAFRSAFRSRRLLVPASAFYEWRRSNNRSQPYAFERADGAPLALAGLWEHWRDPGTGSWLRSLTIITTRAGPDVAFVHQRQPVVVEPDDFAAWLDSGPGGPELQRILAPSPAGTLLRHPVDRAVNSTANDDQTLIEAVELAEDDGTGKGRAGTPPMAGDPPARAPRPGPPSNHDAAEQLCFGGSAAG